MRELHTDAVVFNTANGKKLVQKSEIAFIKADNKYLDFYTEQRVFIECTTLKALEAKWGDDWIRVHRNALVCKSAIQALGAKLAVKCKDKVEMLEVSRRKRPEVRRWLKTLRVTKS